MKKIVSAILTLAMLAAFALPSFAVLCDLDGDEEITAQDARAVLRLAVELDELTDELRALADADGDYQITAADARLVLRKALGINDVDYVSIYKKTLLSLLDELGEDAAAQCWFSFIYVDDDDIPELAVSQGWYHAAGVRVFTIYGGKAIELDRFGSYGQCCYSPRSGYIGSVYSGSGYISYYLCRLENGESVQIWEASNNEGTDGIWGPIEFKVNDEVVSKDEFARQLDENWGVHEFILSPDHDSPDAYELNRTVVNDL